MAVGESKKQAKSGNKITQVSWTDGTAMDVYYGMEHSFQYSSNINCDDELHGLKLSTKAYFTTHFAGCQLTSVGENGVVALDVTGLAKPRWFNQYTFFNGGSAKGDKDGYYSNSDYHICPGVVFQDFFRFPITDSQGNNVLSSIRVTGDTSDQYTLQPRDHPESTDESIEDPNTATDQMDITNGVITAILNYNNTRLVVACGQEIWVYYPELDEANPVVHPGNSVPLEDHGKTGWKKVLTYEAGVTVVGLTCTFEYLKVRAVDEGWNTKVYYYQGNNNLRNTFVYNLVDLTGVRVLRVYNINGIDYYVSSIDGTDGYVNLYKLVGTTPVQLFKQRAGLDPLDVNTKAPYFVGPVGINAAYNNGKFYIADAYGLFQFTYNPQGFDKGYMKWGLYNNVQVYGVCENQGYLYVSTEWGCYIMRVIDTGLPVPESKNGMEITYKDEGYQTQGVLISREFEGKEGGTVTKMLDEIRLNYELNPLTDFNGEIDIYVSPNNLWRNTHTFTEASNWYHVMHIDQKNGKTRTEKSNLFNDLGAGKESSFKFDWQTITYAIVITRYDAPNGPEDPNDPKSVELWNRQVEAQHATPIVRQIDIKYHCKDKVNNVYDIN